MMAKDYIDQLNPQQKAAVEYTLGPQLVIAGAGSGKTRVLTYKLVHLLELGHQPWRLLALTFTNKAAREMRQRIEQMVGPHTAGQLWMGTFHSIFARILRQNADCIGFKPSFTIYDTADTKSLIKTIVRDLDLDDKVYKANIVLNAISTAKNALISPEKYATLTDVLEADRQSRRPRLYEVYRVYRDRCFTAGAMDFDDLLYYTNVLLRDHPDVLTRYQEHFSYVLVDEYQDTNFAQHVIVSQLTRNHHRLCVVGDDAQSIYSFRGANISNILNLKQSYPDLQTFKLEQNYRSTQNIVNAANSLIDKNAHQIRKNIISHNEPGQRIEVVQSYSDYEEGYLVANKISQVKMRTHHSYEDFAILYRTNAQSRVLEESLRKRNIPYRIYGGLSFYQRKEVKDALAYFRLAVNPSDDEALRRIINFPTRGIGETTIGKLTRAAIDNNVSIWHVLTHIEHMPLGINAGTARKLNAFVELISQFMLMVEQNEPADKTAEAIIAKTRLLAMYMSDTTPENLSKQENINELLSGVKEYVTTRTEEGNDDVSLIGFLGEVSLATDQDGDSDDEDGSKERVTLMTAHAAKGLEFKNVFIVGVEEDLFPSAMSSGSQQEIEEERRLLYVALTRAEKYCMMSYASTRYRNGMTAQCSPSRFLRDIDPQYLKLSSGTSISDIGSTLHKKSSEEWGDNAPLWRPRTQYNATRQQRTPNPGTTMPKGMKSMAQAISKPTTANGDIANIDSQLRSGTRIEHSRFGQGTVAEVDRTQPDTRITVEFDNTGRRVLLLKFARLTIISQPEQ